MSFFAKCEKRAAGICVALSLLSFQTWAGDLLDYSISKGLDYTQTSSGVGTIDASNGYIFRALVDGTQPGFVTAASVRPPSNTPKSLSSTDNQQFEYKKKYDTFTKLNENFASGNYVLDITTAHEGIRELGLFISSDSYPATPHLLNFDAAQAFDAGGYFLFNWEYRVDGTAPDFVQFHIDDSAGNKVFETPDDGPEALNANARFALVPRGTLSPGQNYEGWIYVRKTVTLDTSSYSGALGLASYYKRLKFPIKTAPTSTAADVKTYSLTKTLLFKQGPANPPASPQNAWVFDAQVEASAANSVLATSITIPGGRSTNLVASADGKQLELQEKFITRADMDALYPGGTYTFGVTGQIQGSKSALLDLSGDAYPSTPEFTNAQQAQEIDPASDFVLEWSPLANGSFSDWIEVQVEDADGNNLVNTPNFGKSGAFGPYRTSVVIPAGTLKSASAYTAKLTFTRFTQLNVSSYPGALGLAGFATETKLQIKTTGKPPVTTPPTLILQQSASYIQAHGMQFRITGQIGSSVRIEVSTDLKNWSQIGVVVLENGLGEYTEPPAGLAARFYRAIAE